MMGDFLIFTHNGNHFTRDDVSALCDNAQKEHKKKIGDSDKIGHKGVGFKGVFTFADMVYIKSNQFSFCFDKHHSKWKTTTEEKPYPPVKSPVTPVAPKRKKEFIPKISIQQLLDQSLPVANKKPDYNAQDPSFTTPSKDSVKKSGVFQTDKNTNTMSVASMNGISYHIF